MGNIRKPKKKFSRPLKCWDKARIEKERGIKKKFGLKNKRELWKTETFLRKKKDDARKLLALDFEKREKREKELIDSLARYSLVEAKAGIDDVLSLATENFLERRLQTLVWRKGLAGTIDQARQFIVHGHIAINSKKVSIPSYLVEKDEENKISYYGKQMVVQEKKKKEIKKEIDAKKKLEKEFEEAKPAEAESAETTEKATEETSKKEIGEEQEKEESEKQIEEAEKTEKKPKEKKKKEK